MAWIKLDQSLPSHKKTLIASDALDIEPVQLIGHMTMLWLWAIDNAPDGYLDGIPAGVIARAVQWRGDANEFVAALIEAGFIDETAVGKEIHDWEEYAGKLIEKRRSDAERLKNYRESKKEAESVQRTYNVRNTDVAGKSRVEKSRVDTTTSVVGTEVPAPPVNNSIHPAIKAYQELTHEKNPKEVVRNQIIEVIGDSEESLAKWRKVMTTYLLKYQNGRNVGALLDWFKKGITEDVKPNSKKQNGGPPAEEILSSWGKFID